MFWLLKNFLKLLRNNLKPDKALASTLMLKLSLIKYNTYTGIKEQNIEISNVIAKRKFLKFDTSE